MAVESALKPKGCTKPLYKNKMSGLFAAALFQPSTTMFFLSNQQVPLCKPVKKTTTATCSGADITFRSLRAASK